MLSIMNLTLVTDPARMDRFGQDLMDMAPGERATAGSRTIRRDTYLRPLPPLHGRPGGSHRGGLPFASEVTSTDDARLRFAALAQVYVTFAKPNYGLWRLMFGPFGHAPGEETERPSTNGWLEKSLADFARFDVKTHANPQARFFAWPAIHGLSALQSSPAISDPRVSGPVDAQCAFIRVALARTTAQPNAAQAGQQDEPG